MNLGPEIVVQSQAGFHAIDALFDDINGNNWEGEPLT
jgi:hypothetical protein